MEDEELIIVPIDRSHDLSKFDCGANKINSWLHNFAMRNHESGYTKTYLAYLGTALVGYYGVTLTAIANADYFTEPKKEAPTFIPCLLIAKLGVDKQFQGKGIGTALLIDAFERLVAASEIVGGKAVVVDLLDNDLSLVPFYQKLGFMSMDGLYCRYYIEIETVRNAMNE